MSTNLTGTTVSSTFNQLLHVDGGPTATEKIVYSGTGVATALSVGTESASVDNIKLDGNTISTTDTNGNLTLAPNGTGSVAIAKAAITGGTISGITDLALADGGTGASTAVDARANLGLGTMATQASTAVSITGGAISGVTFTGTFAGITSIESVTFATSPAAAGVNLTGTALAADGTDTNINVSITPKGTGSLIASNVNMLGATYDSVSISVTAQDGTPNDVSFHANGTKMYMLGGATNSVYEYVLSTPWRVSTATYSTSFSVTSQDTTPQGIFFRPDGLKFYMIGSTNDTVYQYSMSVAWAITTASYDSKSFSVASQDITPTGVWFRPNGLTMYAVGATGDSVYQYTLSTAWDVSTATYTQAFSVSSLETVPNSVVLTNDGTRMFVCGQSGDDVNVFDLSTPWNVTTAVYTGVVSVATQENAPNGIYVKPDGSKLYAVGSTNDTVYQYSVPSISFELTGTTNINGSATVAQDLVVNGTATATSFQASTALGYAPGAGGQVTQGTSRTTGVTLNKATGEITLFPAGIAGHGADEFTLTNVTIGVNDVVLVNVKSGVLAATRKYYQVHSITTAAGSCVISVGNLNNSAIASETPVLQFVVVKGAIA